MSKFRGIILTTLLLGITTIAIMLTLESAQSPFKRTLSVLFQELGKPVKSVDRIISSLYPVDANDEKLLGEKIKEELDKTSDHSDKETEQYLNSLIKTLCTESNKPFEYQVFLIDGPPNAFALPGGNICISHEMLDILESEAELVSILAHEMGHIERGHLFDGIRDQLLKEKIYNHLKINLADIIHALLCVSFSKTQEDEADEYAFRILIKKGYDPFALSTTFTKFHQCDNDGQRTTSPIDDFLNSHPHSELRALKFHSRAKQWFATYPNERFYRGKSNLTKRITLIEAPFDDEWIRS